MRRHITYGNVVATLALFVALGGTTYAGLRVTSKQLANNTVRSEDIRNNSLRGVDIRNGTIRGGDVRRNGLDGGAIDENKLGTVPNASLVGGVAAADLRVRCPQTAQLRAGVCIEIASRASADFFAASDVCNLIGGRLPLYVELVVAPAPLHPAGEWTAEVSGAPAAQALTVNRNGEIASAPISSASRPYRCAILPSN
jgi:hypothetical protein